METELNKKNNKFKVTKIVAVMCVVSFLLSFVGCGSETKNSSSTKGAGYASTTIVKGSEGIPKISVGEFFKNMGKNTGIYKMIHTPTAEEIAEAKAEKAAADAGAAADPFDESKVPGWQKLVMLALGFLIVYLGAVKGFEPLLLIPIGFGTILVNIPGAGMGDAPHGMLHLI